ncbi:MULTISPECIES: TIGR02594 family protein [unclassified Bradyrhizobium]|uniref:TIGR02594 family protein n=1 Tax=unclassified Bradyrhizobium TaxID=2631580 RepID=UPI0028EB22FD|nr:MULTISPECIES: TIGR02594 family protein [unclassified Bradyrhizobium]
MKRAISALLCAAALAATVSTAEARPRHHHRQYHHQAVVQQEEQSVFGGFQNGLQHGFSAGSSFVERARQFVGETAHQVGVRSTLWCSAFLRKITGATGVDDRALSWESHRRVAPQVGAVVTMGRRGGGHVGIVSGFTAKGDPIVISGNHGHRVAESVYPRHRIRTWVSPT